jgi:hypothetical protein
MCEPVGGTKRLRVGYNEGRVSIGRKYADNGGSMFLRNISIGLQGIIPQDTRSMPIVRQRLGKHIPEVTLSTTEGLTLLGN